MVRYLRIYLLTVLIAVPGWMLQTMYIGAGQLTMLQILQYLEPLYLWVRIESYKLMFLHVHSV